MKFTCKTYINLPRSEVVKLWDNDNNFKEWQDGFVKIEYLFGEPRATGSQARIFLEQGKQKLELLETVIANYLPNELKAKYEHTHMTNTLTTRFKSVSEHKTEYIAEIEYTKFNGFMPKLMAFLFPGMFKRQTQKWLNQFKRFAEAHANPNS